MVGNPEDRFSHNEAQLYRGELGGLVVVSDSGVRGGGVRYLTPPCVLEQRHIYSPKGTSNTQEAVAPS